MAWLARAEVFDPGEVSAFHCINRCVRRCFLCGHDPLTGNNFDHRKRWLEDRFRFLAACLRNRSAGVFHPFNHFHIILRNRPDVVATWDDDQVARRWLRLCAVRKTPAGEPEEPTQAEIDVIVKVPQRLREIRRRPSDISWFMRMVAEPLARAANFEEQTSGRFWQGRFKAVKLCDQAALLACGVYVDLNPIRAAVAKTQKRATSHRRSGATKRSRRSVAKRTK